jgi:hypothetical protein
MAAYHYILTMQRPNPRGGFSLSHAEGVLDVDRDTTRADVLAYAKQSLAKSGGWPDTHASVVFFAVELNDLAV